MKKTVILLCVTLCWIWLFRPVDVFGEELAHDGVKYPLYPSLLSERPDIPSPLAAADGREYVVGLTENGEYTLFEVTVENGEELNYRKNMWYTRGRQLEVDSSDFPSLATAGLHSDGELAKTKRITGKPVAEITRIGRPGQFSGTGFMAHDEDIISVLSGDNRIVRRLGLTHPDLARPLFHVFNVIQSVMSHAGHGGRGDAQAILYNDRIVNLKFHGAKGWQESIFNDEILGYWQIEMWRELDDQEQKILSEQYPDLTGDEYSQMLKRLSYIHTGEMVPFYIMRYGFYEGHTGYRADPIAIASIFGLHPLENITERFAGELPSTLNEHHVSADSTGIQTPER